LEFLFIFLSDENCVEQQSTATNNNTTDKSEENKYYTHVDDYYYLSTNHAQNQDISHSNTVVEFQIKNPEMFDTTGMFFWCEEQHIDDVLLDNTRRHDFTNHIVVCIFADTDSPLIGLRNFVLPLRASNYFYEELKPIVFVGNTDFLAKEWKSICNFPKVYIVEVHGLNYLLGVLAN
jgi:hypothetical protein